MWECTWSKQKPWKKLASIKEKLLRLKWNEYNFAAERIEAMESLRNYFGLTQNPKVVFIELTIRKFLLKIFKIWSKVEK